MVNSGRCLACLPLGRANGAAHEPVYSGGMTKNKAEHHIRPAVVADVGAMFRVRGAVGENTMSAEELAAQGITPAAIAQAVSSGPCAWVAKIQGEVVGFAMVDLGNACLFALFVLPAFEGQGIGTALVRVCEEALFQQHECAWLETAQGSRAAQLYRHLGWGSEVDICESDIRMQKRRPAHAHLD